MTSVPDHGGKLIEQVADDMGLTHTPTRKRAAPRRRGAPRRKPTPQSRPGHTPEASADYNPEGVI
jgi:hypothetical protein